MEPKRMSVIGMERLRIRSMIGSVEHLQRRVSAATVYTHTKIKHGLIDIISRRMVNLTLASAIIFLSLYVTFVSVLHRDFIHPIKYEEAKLTWPLIFEEYNGTFNQTTLSQIDQHINSAVSIFILWLLSLIAGALFKLMHLPNIIGILCTGIALRNIPSLNGILDINDAWSDFFRKAALTIVLMRAGMGLDPVALKRTKIGSLGMTSVGDAMEKHTLMVAVFRLGFISLIFEFCTILLVSHFIFGVTFYMSILFGTIVSATGPAVIIPTVLDLVKETGSKSNIPTVIIASCTFDNMICIMAYTVTAALIFTTVDLKYEIAMTFTTIVVSVCFGLLVGRILWVFPHEGSHHKHFIRGSLLLSICLALNFGTLAIEVPSCGVIATVLLNMVATIKWKEKKYKEAECLALMWNFFAMQIMFGMIGYDFEIKRLNFRAVLKAAGVVAIGQMARIISNFCLSFGYKWRLSEQLFVSFAFMSKATLQAALAPQVISKTTEKKMYKEAVLLRAACVIAIMVLAPTGQFVLNFFGSKILQDDSHSRVNDVNMDRLERFRSISAMEQQNSTIDDDINEENEISEESERNESK